MALHTHTSGTGSTAALYGHPLHAMLVGFPITLLIGALVTDIAYLALSDPFWARSSFWLLAGGLLAGLVAAIPGAVDLFTIEHARGWSLAWTHGLLNLGVLALALVNLILRWGDQAGAILPYGLLLSAVSAVALVVTGWLGGEMVYGHGVGVSKSVGAPEGHSHEHHEEAAPHQH